MRSLQKGTEMKIIRVPIPTPTLWPHTTTNCYLIGNSHVSLLVDAGYDQPETRILLEKAIEENGLAQPKSILLTHYHLDHAPGVRQLIDWSPTVFCHRNERQAILEAISPYNELMQLNDGDFITISDEVIKIIHAPGHTQGQLNLYIPSQKLLIAGDNIVAEGTTWVGTPDGDIGEYLQTLNRFKHMAIEKIGPGHGDWVTDPYDHIDFVIARRLLRENQILSFLKEYQSLTTSSLTKMIYEENIHPSIFEVARRTTEAHLMKLVKEEKVVQLNASFLLNY